MAVPQFFTTPFASEGSKNEIPEQGSVTDVNASYQLGFPPLTFQLAGGTPPNGKDVNGILHEITKCLQYIQAGSGLWQYDADFATAIGGYQKGMRVLHANKKDQWVCTADNNLTNPDDDDERSGWELVKAIPDQMSLAGLIAMWHGAENTIPENSLVCKGQTILSDTYPELYTKLFGTFVAGQSFTLPNFSNGYYPRGWGANTQALATRQSCALPNITGSHHYAYLAAGNDTSSGAFSQTIAYGGGGWDGDHSHRQITTTFDASQSNAVYGRRGTQTVETNNVAVLFIIYTS